MKIIRMIFMLLIMKKIIFNKSPKIQTDDLGYGLINPKFPYSAMYLMDRQLMKEYLNSNAIKFDFSFTNNFLKSKAPSKELLNISHAFLNVPKGFFNKLMIPFEKIKIFQTIVLLNTQMLNMRILKS